MFESVFGKSFNSGKCKTLLRLASSRIKLLRNKREIQLKQMKREFVQLLQTNQEPSARIRVEHIFCEQNIMAAYEILELFCELIVVRLPIIDSQRHCPIDLHEAVASLIFAAPRCSDLPELQQVRNLFAAKYGKEFVVAAAELRPDCGVNRLVIEKLSIRAPSGEVKLKLMKDIAEEQGFDWDASASESELLKAPEDLLEGPSRFLGASQMPFERPSNMSEPAVEENQAYVRHDSDIMLHSSVEPSTVERQFIPFVRGQPASSRTKMYGQNIVHDELRPVCVSRPTSFHENDYQPQHSSSTTRREESFKDVSAAALAAAESAERAAAAARAAASLVKLESSKGLEKSSSSDSDDLNDDVGGGLPDAPNVESGSKEKYFNIRMDSFDAHLPKEIPFFDRYDEEGSHKSQRLFSSKQDSWKFGDEGIFSSDQYDVRLSMNNGTGYANTDAVFDKPSCERQDSLPGNLEASGGQLSNPQSASPSGDAKSVNRSLHVHPKLPDYDDLAVRFEALRSSRR